jgi:hypothetical protein
LGKWDTIRLLPSLYMNFIAQHYTPPESGYSFIDGAGNFFDTDILIIQFLWAVVYFALGFKFGKWTLNKFNLGKRISLLLPLVIIFILKTESWIVFETTSLYRNIVYGGERAGYGFISWDVPAFLLVSFFILGYISGIYKGALNSNTTGA